MTNKLDSIIAESNPFKGLTGQQIDLYFILKSLLEEHWKTTPKDAGLPSYTNNTLAHHARCHPTTVSRNLTALEKAGILEFQYMPTKYGTLRFIVWRGLSHE